MTSEGREWLRKNVRDEGARWLRDNVQDLANTITTTAVDAMREIQDLAKESATELRDAAEDTTTHMQEAMDQAAEQVRDTLPSFDEVLSQVVYLPGVRVDRTEYLSVVLSRYPLAVVREAVKQTPVRAGIPLKKLHRIAGKSLGKEARRTLAASVVAGLPGGMAAAVTIPTDVLQLYAHLMRAIQMLSYLYGWRDTCRIDGEQMDEGAMRAIILFLGVMAGDGRADRALELLAPLRQTNDVHSALVSDECEEVVRVVADGLAVRMAHRMTGQVVGKSVPLAGAVISGTISYGGFSDMWKRLRKQLEAIG